MKRLLLATTMAVAVCPAWAADLNGFPTKAPLTPIMDPWTGFYLGIHGGYGWATATTDQNDFTATGATVQTVGRNPNATGTVFGGHAGYNWQFHQLWVAGLELDYDTASLSDSQTVAVPNYGTFTFGGKVDALASVRARVGFLIAPDLLFYGTGGLGYAHSTGDFEQVTGRITYTEHAAGSSWGWVGGGGVEWHVPGTPVFVRGEYLHYDLNSQTASWPVNPLNNVILDTTGKGSIDVVRGGLTYKF